MEADNAISPFLLEFYDLGRLAKNAIGGLCRIYLLSTAAEQTGEMVFSYPEDAEISESVLAVLQTAAISETSVLMPDACYVASKLSLPDERGLGSICFEREAGTWTEEELSLLNSMISIYTYMLRTDRDRHDASAQKLVWKHMMDSTHAYIYVTDPETDEILFMNSSMKRAFGLEAPEGQVCWKVLQSGQQGRCTFCPVRMLSESQDTPAYVWEEKNTITGRTYENYDSLIRWTDGRFVHFQHSTDVTEARRIHKAAMTDELTGAFSRRAGKEGLSLLIEEFAGGSSPISVCMIDVNGLKEINDVNGHAAGDEVLTKIAATIRGLLHGREFLMRLSGDEFVAVLPGVCQDDAARRMQEALKAFDMVRPSFFHDFGAFCYGIIEVCGHMTVREVLARADERMYQQKRALHIRKAEALLQRPGHEDASAPFYYDRSLLYDALIASTDDYIYVCNMKTGVFRYSPAMVAEFGLPGEIVPNAAAVWGAKVHPHDKRIFLESNQEIADGRTDTHCVEYRAQNVRGEWLWLRCRGHMERDANGDPELFAGFITNLGKKNKLDPLTGLFNKFELENDIILMLGAAKPCPFTFMLLGLDGLKQINSLYDRAFGDEVIRMTAQKLRSLLPSNTTVYRFDGDEFAILMRGGMAAAAGRLFDSIRDAFDGQQAFDGKKFYCTLSCGCAFAPEDGETYADLEHCASAALEYAKRSGKNRMECYNSDMVAERHRALEITEFLRESVEHGFRGFQMYYQPVFNSSRELIGAEALARWSCDKYGAVGPDEFIPLLEQSGLILPVGRWIFEDVLRVCARWEKTMPTFNMSINLSYIQLEDKDFCDYITESIRKANVDPTNIILELTESYLAANMTQIAERLIGIRLSGIRIAMDDFGTGYSSLGVLKQAPIDIAKIDRAFVKGIHSSAFDSAFLRLVVELCNVLGIDTCLEGVETEDEFDAVRPMPLSYIQGFLLGRPMPEDQFESQFLSNSQELQK